MKEWIEEILKLANSMQVTPSYHTRENTFRIVHATPKLIAEIAHLEAENTKLNEEIKKRLDSEAEIQAVAHSVESKLQAELAELKNQNEARLWDNEQLTKIANRREEEIKGYIYQIGELEALHVTALAQAMQKVCKAAEYSVDKFYQDHELKHHVREWGIRELRLALKEWHEVQKSKK